MIEEQDVEQEETISGRFELKPTLKKAWHAPNNSRFMDLLPPIHRRGIIIAAIALVARLPLPPDDTPDAPVVTREAQLNVQLQSQPPTEGQLRAQLVIPQNDPDQMAPVAPESIQKGQPEEQPQTTQTQPFRPDSGIDNQWHSYHVKPDKTMTQLFRGHGLPATGVYAMAQVEDAGKLLNNLQNRQMVKVRQSASDVVTGLTIDTGNNQQVLFTRQSDDNFIRARQTKGQPKAS